MTILGRVRRTYRKERDVCGTRETGVLFPGEWIAEICRSRGVLYHCDAVQAAGKVEASPPAFVAHLSRDDLFQVRSAVFTVKEKNMCAGKLLFSPRPSIVANALPEVVVGCR